MIIFIIFFVNLAMDGDSEEWIVVTKKTKGIQKNQKKKKGEIVWEAGRPIYSQ